MGFGYCLIVVRFAHSISTRKVPDMAKVKSTKLTTWSSVCSLLFRQLRLYGPDFILSGGDKSTINPDNKSSQEAIAKKLKITKAAYSKIENADVVINIFHISNICPIYGISVVDFMGMVEQEVRRLEDEGIKVEKGKVPFRADNIRWLEKLKEKASAKFNSKVRELKKSGLYSAYDDEELEALKNECKQLAYEEIEEKQSLEDAMKEYEESKRK